MKKIFCCVIFVALWISLFASTSWAENAQLILNNNSGRTMAIKVMRDNGTLYSSGHNVAANSSLTIYIPNTGNYYLKIKAIHFSNPPVYTKGNPFKVYVGADGYSVLTITFSLKESRTPSPLEGRSINKNDFEKDRD